MSIPKFRADMLNSDLEECMESLKIKKLFIIKLNRRMEELSKQRE